MTESDAARQEAIDELISIDRRARLWGFGSALIEFGPTGPTPAELMDLDPAQIEVFLFLARQHFKMHTDFLQRPDRSG